MYPLTKNQELTVPTEPLTLLASIAIVIMEAIHNHSLVGTPDLDHDVCSRPVNIAQGRHPPLPHKPYSVKQNPLDSPHAMYGITNTPYLL